MSTTIPDPSSAKMAPSMEQTTACGAILSSRTGSGALAGSISPEHRAVCRRTGGGSS